MNAHMYRQHILELYKNPENFGPLEGKTHEHAEHNRICGDEIKVQLIVQDEKVKDIKFSGSGCAISIASASLLTEKTKGLTVEQIKNLTADDIIKLLGIPISPGRIKCATLCLEAVKGALE